MLYIPNILDNIVKGINDLKHNTFASLSQLQ